MSLVLKAADLLTHLTAIDPDPFRDAALLSHLWECQGIVAQYGGGENLQAAALAVGLIRNRRLAASHFTSIKANLNWDVAKLVSRFSAPIGYSEEEAFNWRLHDINTRCQGFGILTIADGISRMRKAVREGDPAKDGGTKLKQRQWQIAALRQNDRVMKAEEYPELRTPQAYAELLELFGRLRKGLLWDWNSEQAVVVPDDDVDSWLRQMPMPT